MVAGNRNSYFVKLGKGQHGMRRAIASGRCSENPHAICVHVWELGGHLLDHGHMIFKRAAEISIRKQVEGARATGGPTAVYHYDDEP